MKKIQEFKLNIMTYSPKIAALNREIAKYDCYKKPLILNADVNIDLKSGDE